jgi:hypothetical protein
MWPPDYFETNLCLLNSFTAAQKPEGQLRSPHNRLVYRFLRDSADGNFSTVAESWNLA